MSAYVVGKKTIDRIVTYLHGGQRYDSIYHYYPAINEAYKGDPNKLGQNLWAMNVKAVDQGYKEVNPVELYQYECRPASEIQVYKSLQGYLYQCAEGDIPETALFKDMERLANRLASHIVMDLLAYEKAEWA